MRVVLDTNVVVSALLTPGGTAAKVLALVAAGRLGLLVDDRILAEYETVLARPKFPIGEGVAARFVRQLESVAEYVPPVPSSAALPDADDLKFLECALAGHADCIVTGNRRHFPKSARGPMRVLSPAQVIAAGDDGSL